MSRARLAAAAAAALIAVPAAAFQRSQDPCTHVCFYWASRSVTYVVNEHGSWSAPSCNSSTGGTLAGQPWQGAVETAFQQWPDATLTGASSPCTDLQLQYGGTTTSTAIGFSKNGPNENLIVFRHGPCSAVVASSDPCWNAGTCGNQYDCWEYADPSVIALTTVTYDPATGAIRDADMELNDWGGDPGSLSVRPADGWYLTCDPAPGLTKVPPLCSSYGQSSCIYMDVQNTVTHESGHFIGLAHPTANCVGDLTCESATMFASASIGEISKRVLSQDDAEGVCTIYPAGAATATCPYRDTCSKGCGCGAGAGPSGVLALIGLLLAAPRRLRRARRP